MDSIYSTSFYEDQADGSGRSADIIVPLVLDLTGARSVVDFGCGLGTWLQAFAKAGIRDYLGVDGAYVDLTQLQIPSRNFRAMDLARGLSVGRRFDLACSLEVAEHLPESSARDFVAMLVDAAPVVLFSAAIPGQCGMNHVNEQRQSYWARLFAEHGYVTLDCIRPAVHQNPQVEFWYQQNILMFCVPEAVPAGLSTVAVPYLLDRIHPQMISNWQKAPHTGAQAITAIKRALVVIIGKIALHGRWKLRHAVSSLASSLNVGRSTRLRDATPDQGQRYEI